MQRPNFALFLSTAAPLAAALTLAGAARADECGRVRAKINLATGTIGGNQGLKGAVAFAQDGAGVAPPTAPADASVFSGTLTITTPRGALEVRETGMFSSRAGNPAGPVLVSWGDVLGGTGDYARATGDLTFAGRLVDGALIVDVSGELCRP
jgi:hypothetical protein